MSDKNNINFGEDFLGLSALVAGRKVHVVSDKNVAALHLDVLKKALDCTFSISVLPASEKAKTFRFTKKIIADMRAAECGRDSVVIAFGGGSVGDAAGFAASIYMRGADAVQVPTTLLAMIDSCAGGKTAIDFLGKNTVGSFHEPCAVYVNFKFLNTLPQKDIISGLGEAVKYTLLDEEILDYLINYKKEILSLTHPHADRLIKMCLKLKTDIVACDLKDKNLRKTLNAGHTIGHALEYADNYKSGHGVYVLSGIFHECEVADKAGIIDPEYKRTIQRLASSFAPILPLPKSKKFLQGFFMDKKNVDGKVTFILPASRGLVREVSVSHSDAVDMFGSN